LAEREVRGRVLNRIKKIEIKKRFLEKAFQHPIKSRKILDFCNIT
jgi:hypothetical protein